MHICFILESTQLEDPRQEWRVIQEEMLREYLQTAQDVLEVSCKYYYYYYYSKRFSNLGIWFSRLLVCIYTQSSVAEMMRCWN